MLDKLRTTLDDALARKRFRFSPHRTALEDIPPGLFPYWKRSAHLEFPGIPRDAFFFARAVEGLMLFFDCVRHSDTPCALPSKAVDSVWHAWERLAPSGLDAFCTRHFGRAIAHVEAASMTAQMEESLLNCLVQARRREARAWTALSLPRLFALDRELKMPGGFWYRLACGQVAFSPMNQDGRRGRDMFFPSSLAPVQLLAAGLLSQAGYEQYVRRASSGATVGFDLAYPAYPASCEYGGASGCGGACGGD